MQEITIESVLSNALKRLKRMDSYDSYLDYIKSEWYSSVSDLLLALEDKNAWTDLKIPGRLKLEIKSELLAIQAKKDVDVKMQLKEHWVRYFSKPDNAFFYCNSETFVSRWELPEGNVEIHDDISTENSPANSEKLEESNSKRSSTKANDSSLGFGRKALNFDESCLDVLIERSQSPKANPLLSAIDPLTADVIRIDNAYAIPEEVSIARIASVDNNDHSHVGNTSSSSRYSEFPRDRGSVDSLDSDLDAEEDEPDPLMAKRLCDMGFSEAAVNAALLRSDNNISAAASILLLAKRNEDKESISRVVSPSKIKNSTSSIIKKSFHKLRVFPPPSAPPHSYDLPKYQL